MSNRKGIWYPDYDGYGVYPNENEIKLKERIVRILCIIIIIFILTILLFFIG